MVQYRLWKIIGIIQTFRLKTADRFHRQRNKPTCVPALRSDRRRNSCCGGKIDGK